MSGLDFKVFVVRLAEMGRGYVKHVGKDFLITWTRDPLEAQQITSKEAADRLSERILGSVVRVRLIHEETI